MLRTSIIVSLAALSLVIPLALVRAQSEASATAPAASPQTANPNSHPESDKTEEIASREETTTFKVNVNLVQLRVVVRDGSGHAVGKSHEGRFRDIR